MPSTLATESRALRVPAFHGVGPFVGGQEVVEADDLGFGLIAVLEHLGCVPSEIARGSGAPISRRSSLPQSG